MAGDPLLSVECGCGRLIRGCLTKSDTQHVQAGYKHGGLSPLPPLPFLSQGSSSEHPSTPPEGKASLLQSQARPAGGEMRVRAPGLGTHPSFLPSVLASVPGEVGWGDFCGGGLHPPDLLGVLGDGPVTGELARAGDVPDDFLSPLPGVLGRGEARAAVTHPTPARLRLGAPLQPSFPFSMAKDPLPLLRLWAALTMNSWSTWPWHLM